MWWKGLGWGTIDGIILLAAAGLKSDWQLAINISSMIAVGCLILAAILSGSMNKGAQYRTSQANENAIDRERRIEQVTWLAMLSLPNLAIALILYRLI